MKANVSDEGRAPDVPQLNKAGKPTSQKPKAPANAGSEKCLVTALLVLSAIPLAFGAVRLTQLAAARRSRQPTHGSLRRPCRCNNGLDK